MAATSQKIAKRSGQAVCWQQAHADSGSPIGESLDDRQRSTGHRYLDFARQACQKMPKTDFGSASYCCVRIGNNSKRHLPPFWVFG